MTTLTFISDTHTKHSQLIIEPADILIHCGDFSYQGRLQETIDFLKWIEVQPAKHRIFIEGNHDFMGEENPRLFKDLLAEYAPTTIHLRNEGCEVEGIKFWGRPITKTYFDWAFMADPESPKMLNSLKVIPSDIDVLITHGGPFNILDKTKSGENVGCKDLLNELERIKCKVVAFGHIHEERGTIIKDDKIYINCSILNERYINSNKPIKMEYKNGKFETMY